MTFQGVFEIAFPLFLIMDPIGNAGMCLALLKHHHPQRQRRIIMRELFFALVIIVLFQFLGDGLMALLNIHQSTLRVAGGIILFLISLKMVFPSEGDTFTGGGHDDPFIVPIAVPFIAGPSLLAAVMLFAHTTDGGATLFWGILLAWASSAIILLLSPTLTRVLGKRGMRASERLMGLVLILLSVQMLEDGVRMFITSL